jgi:hypothetical protein
VTRPYRRDGAALFANENEEAGNKRYNVSRKMAGPRFKPNPKRDRGAKTPRRFQGVVRPLCFRLAVAGDPPLNKKVMKKKLILLLAVLFCVSGNVGAGR